MPGDTKLIEFLVEHDDEGERIDVFLSRKAPVLTRSRARKLLDEDCVRVRGKAVKPSFRVQEGDRIVVEWREPAEYSLEPEDIPVAIVYEDDALLVVDKPPGMVVHPAAGNYRGTLVNALLFHAENFSGIGGILRPGIVHRLDRNTSGLIVVAKSDEAHVALARQFSDRTVRKTYRALVHGSVREDSGIIDMAIGRHPSDRKKMSTKSRRGKQALSRWEVVERFSSVSLLDVRIETGRTHQIRVHLSAAGYPIVGDSVYGSSKHRIEALRDMTLRRILGAMKRQALHAAGLEFTHPVTERLLSFSSPLPPDMASVCETLRQHAARDL